MNAELAAAIALLAILAVDDRPALAQSPVAQAELMAVKKGVFSLKPGQSMDLTDRGILLHLGRIITDPNGEFMRANFTINGEGGSYYLGTRRNLKTERATKDFVKDFRACFLDFVTAEAPVGAPASATFRLLCE